ncbi:MAG: substrate-binding domain-containing protein [Anaerolineales bacterium]
MRKLPTLLLIWLLVMLSGCGSPAPPRLTPLISPPPPASPTSPPTVPQLSGESNRRALRLATTSSLQDSGLLAALLPDFEKAHNARISVLAVGVGEAIELARRGEADVLLINARAEEEAFVESGEGLDRVDVLYGDFVIVGSGSDPASVAGLALAAEAFARITQQAAAFVSRGDGSGTHLREAAIWAGAGIASALDSGWYLSTGQGAGATLEFANAHQAYALTDRGVWLAQQSLLPRLALLLGGLSLAEDQDKSLLDRYSVIPVNPDKHPGVDGARWPRSLSGGSRQPKRNSASPTMAASPTASRLFIQH